MSEPQALSIVPFRPENHGELRARFWAALQTPRQPEDIEAASGDPAQVFDFHEGIRLIAFIEAGGDKELLHFVGVAGPGQEPLRPRSLFPVIWAIKKLFLEPVRPEHTDIQDNEDKTSATIHVYYPAPSEQTRAKPAEMNPPQTPEPPPPAEPLTDDQVHALLNPAQDPNHGGSINNPQ